MAIIVVDNGGVGILEIIDEDDRRLRMLLVYKGKEKKNHALHNHPHIYFGCTTQPFPVDVVVTC